MYKVLDTIMAFFEQTVLLYNFCVCDNYSDRKYLRQERFNPGYSPLPHRGHKGEILKWLVKDGEK